MASSGKFPEFTKSGSAGAIVRRFQNRRKPKPVTKQQVQAMIASKQTLKFYDNHTYVGSATSGGINIALSTIPQGNTDSTRSGDSVSLETLEVRGELYLQGAGGTNDFTDQIRVIIYMWHPVSSGAAPVIASILQDVSVAQSLVMSAYSWDSKPQFSVLYDKNFSLSGNGPSDVFFDFRKSFGSGHLATWAGGSTTLQSEGIFMIIASNSLVATHPIYNFYSRVTYLDS